MASNMVSKPPKQRQMVWNEQKNVVLCSEVLAERPYQYKKWSTEGKMIWSLITDTLGKKDDFYVTTKSLRDHLNLLLAKQGKKGEDDVLGINVPFNELDCILDELIEDMEACEEELADTNKKSVEQKEKEKTAAENVRKTALESFSKTRKCQAADDGYH